ncbi:hypothetical protein, partial [Aeromonas allosaccharophila]
FWSDGHFKCGQRVRGEGAIHLFAPSQGIELVFDIANRLWQKMITGNTGVIVIDKLEPEIAELWFSYCDGKISLEDVTKEVDILEPILIQRLKDNKD